MRNRDLLKKLSNVPDDTNGELNKKSNTDHTHKYAGSSTVGGVATEAAKTTGTLTVKGNSTSAIGTFNGSANKTITITPANIGAATATHGHNYAGSSSDGGAATSANKVNSTLTISTNGTQAAVFDGSSVKSVDITPANIGAAESSHTHGTLTVKGSGTTAIGTYNGTATTVTITPANIGAATSSHTHNYAGSSSAGGAATSANKVNKSLIIQGNGIQLGTFDGSTATTVNVTASNIGAATSGHTHSNLTINGNGTQLAVYNGSSAKSVNITPTSIGAATGDESGIATEAAKVSNGLTIKGSDTTKPIGTFDGSEATTVTITPDNIGASASGHTHNYAGSSSAGGVANQAAKTTGTLTIQGNGTQIDTFNGSANKTVNITPSNIGAATSSHTHGTLTVKGSGTTAIGTYNGGASTITITPSNIGAATSGHTHSYAGSSSVGGPATSANKVNSTLVIQGNGTQLGTFNGSAATTINITTDSIGASESGHTHNYLPLSGGTVVSTNFGPVIIERTGSTNGAAIAFKNGNGILGYVGMNGDVDSGLVRYSSDTKSSYTVLDTGNYKNTITPANIGAATSGHTHSNLTIQGNGTQLAVYNGSGAKSVNITPANIGAATSGHTHGTLTVKGSGTSSIGTYNGGASTITITPANIGAAAATHGHNYAGSSSDGGAATSANKVNNSLTIQGNGEDLGTFDGSTTTSIDITPDVIGASASGHSHSTLTIKGSGTSAIGTYDGTAAKTVTITPANIGAATSDHTHNYAGSSSAGGVANQAAKTTGTLTIQGNGTAIDTFNGSANKTVNITASGIGAAASSHTHGTLTIKGNGTSAIGTYNGGAATVTITPANIGAATATHGHSYAGSATDGGAATSANKVNSTLTINTNGTEAAVFDGSSAKSVDITASSIGAAASSHTHGALTIQGNGTAIGSYNGAAKTINITPSNIGAATSGHTHSTLTIQGNGTQLQTFNGSAAKTVNITPANIGAATSGHGHDAITSIKKITDWNTATVNGFIEGNNASNGPETTTGTSDLWYWGMRMQHSGGYGAQIAIKNGGNRMFFRSQDTSGTGTWNEIYHTNNKPSAADIGAATSGHTHSNLIIQGNGTQIGTYNGGAKTINITPANIGAATSSHTHGTLSIKGNGTNAIGTYNGGAATITITPSNIGAATSDHGHGTLTIKGNGTSAIGTYNGSAATVTITPANIGAATSSHTHNYAGSSSAGGAATSANKVNSALTIQGNGTALGSFDGSAAKTVNITPSNIGAATSGHTHNYAGSSSAGGAATSANKVNKALTINVNGTQAAVFDGSVAKTVNITTSSGDTSHGLLNTTMGKELENTTTDGGWGMINSTYAGFLLMSLRTNANAPNWILPSYAAGIVFGGSDTKGVMSVSYYEPKVRFAGGAGTGPNWYYTVTGANGGTYDLTSFVTKSYVDTQLGDIATILAEINGE